MRTVKSRKTGQVVGDTVGRRKDGSIAVLFDDDSIEWYSAEDFNATFEVI